MIYSLGGKHSLDLVWFPPPQVTEHGLHSVQGPNEGQGKVLHSLISKSGFLQGLSDLSVFGKPHSLVLCCCPPPHVALHSDHFDHGPSSVRFICKFFW